MRLYLLQSSDIQDVYGTPSNPLVSDVLVVAQKHDCSEFLALSAEGCGGVGREVNLIPDGFIFTYCQAWGLTVSKDTITRVIADLRKKSYPPVEDFLDATVKSDNKEIENYVSKCLAVKIKYPKLVW